MDKADIIKARREELGMSYRELSEKTGYSKSVLQRYESGTTKKIPVDRLEVIAKALKLDIFSLYDFDEATLALTNHINQNTLKHPDIAEDVITFPVIGEIAAGYNEITIEDWSGDTVDVPASYLKGRKREEFFVLSVHGDSMYPMYLNGDKVLILKQNTLNHSGDVGAILYDGECATLKKVEYVQGEDWLRLVPINPEYQPKLIEGPDLELCRVIGIPKLLIREIEYK